MSVKRCFRCGKFRRQNTLWLHFPWLQPQRGEAGSLWRWASNEAVFVCCDKRGGAVQTGDDAA